MDANALFVEDDRSIREVTSLELEQAGFRVTGCGDGREGLELFARERFDLVLLDVMQMRLKNTLRSSFRCPHPCCRGHCDHVQLRSHERHRLDRDGLHDDVSGDRPCGRHLGDHSVLDERFARSEIDEYRIVAAPSTTCRLVSPRRPR